MGILKISRAHVFWNTTLIEFEFWTGMTITHDLSNRPVFPSKFSEATLLTLSISEEGL